ncbi:hypothetical protein RHECNPAF_2190047 [Rhizobium etli CNPAF512]|nr:hypothetical protein RHECNPAF_2190047 [Rhizobium etli CNPAF512]
MTRSNGNRRERNSSGLVWSLEKRLSSHGDEAIRGAGCCECYTFPPQERALRRSGLRFLKQRRGRATSLQIRPSVRDGWQELGHRNLGLFLQRRRGPGRCHAAIADDVRPALC